MSIDRYIRYSDLVSPDKLANARVMIAGVGAIGRQVALQLSAMGVGHLTLIDPDKVDEVNLGPQGYKSEQIGILKVGATISDCLELNPDCIIDSYVGDAQKSDDVYEYIFCCVDSITARKEIWARFSRIPEMLKFYCDGRMSAEICRVLAITNPDLHEYYSDTLFDANKAYEAPCTARSTIYCANIAAGLMVSQFVKQLRDFPILYDIEFNMLAMSLVDLTKE